MRSEDPSVDDAVTFAVFGSVEEFPGLAHFAKAVAGRPVSYAAVLRMKADSSSSSTPNSRMRFRNSQGVGSSSQDWPPFSRHRFSALSSQEDYMSEESEEFGPIFIQEPDDAIFSLDMDNKKVIMNCEARGNPAPVYSWLINGTNVNVEADFRYSMIDGNLIIHNTSEPNDHGRYQCRAENSIGIIMSREAVLQFAYLEAFSGRTRGAVSVREGQGVVLMCAPPPHSPAEIIYSWVFNELPSFVAEDSRRFISQEMGNLYISKVQPLDVGSYVCQVKNTVTNARVLSPPTPLTLKTDELFFHRQCVLVKLAIGEIISQHKINRINGALPERDVASFIARSHEPNGQAKCMAVTSGASTYFRDAHASPAAGVMGEYEPKIEAHFPQTVLAAKGVTVRLECFALGNPIPTITWRKMSGNIPKKARLRKSQAVLEIPNIQLEDSGSYECKAENTRGGTTYRGHLQVYTLPQWISMINDTQLDSGEQLRWECRAAGKPRPTYRWMRNGEPLSPQSRVEMVNGELIIHRLQQADSGMYQCIAENKYGSIYSSAELKILASAPIFSTNPVRLIATVGRDVSLECRPRASPKPRITWKRNDRRVQPSRRIMLLRNNTLRIINSSRTDEGNYVCRAENQFGSAELMTVLLVKEPMRVELSPVRVEVTVGESVVLSCKVTHDPSLEVSFFWLLNNQPLNAQHEGGHFEYIQTQSSTADLMIRSILLKHAGKYGCRAETSADSVLAEAELLVRGPPGPPGVVIVEEITDTTATLSWSHGVDNHSPINTYNVQARSPFSLGWQTVKTDPDPVTGNMESAMAVELNPWVEYEFRVVATNAIGTGDPSSPSRAVRTKEAVPSVAPGSVRGGNGRRHELVISWEPVSEEFQNGEGFGYIVAFRANGTRGWKEKMVTSADSTTYKYRDETFPPLTPFEVRVGVYNNKGDGPFSGVVTVFSAEGGEKLSEEFIAVNNMQLNEPREPPSELQAFAISSSEIKVTWKPPSPGPGRPQGYEVSYWKDMEQEETAKKPRTTGNETNMLLTGLEGNTQYLISVKGFNSVGQGPSSSAIRIRTKKNAPSLPPGNLMWIQEGNNVSLSWDPVKARDNESAVIGYKVLLRQEGRGHSQVTRTPNSAVVLTLPEGGTYIIEVRAVSEGGEGAASAQVRLLTSSGVRAKSGQLSIYNLPAGVTWTALFLSLMVPSFHF
ncbi:Contactin-5 Precursor [Triplophysa tibetana]|uniref:Contactin-5 n=1 Tax=Triplophysa tibetana TaxID=1572043 RepID=A0A5A9P1X2_9TELE|nr:Contactin-5 Precursor [Triplophysa tibetana]